MLSLALRERITRGRKRTGKGAWQSPLTGPGVGCDLLRVGALQSRLTVIPDTGPFLLHPWSAASEQTFLLSQSQTRTQNSLSLSSWAAG